MSQNVKSDELAKVCKISVLDIRMTEQGTTETWRSDIHCRTICVIQLLRGLSSSL